MSIAPQAEGDEYDKNVAGPTHSRYVMGDNLSSKTLIQHGIHHLCKSGDIGTCHIISGFTLEAE
ncbi:MAG: hypothetical protein DRH24_03810 [Deltaproteobacteria bacterium]|nr:MAG: hypothetical protein DRH24_03810 [Deltaproteobacteria bacterium]